MRAPSHQFQARSRFLLQRKLNLLDSLLILSRRQSFALSEKKWGILQRIVEETLRRMTEVDVIDKKLSWMVASEARNCGSKRRLFRSQEMKLLLGKMNATLDELDRLERENIRRMKEEMNSVRARLARI